MQAGTVRLDGSALTAVQVEGIARQRWRVDIDDAARARVDAARAIVDSRAAGRDAIYGVNTGFGSLSRQRIDADGVRQVQENLIRSHAAGVGEPLPESVVRAMMAILAASLCRGHSGVRIRVIEQICTMLNERVTPVVPSRGSVGASGDLAPLAHVALAMMGEGEVVYGGLETAAAHALKQAEIEPLSLEAKEGLALINGTHLMCAIGALAMEDIRKIQHAAVLSAAMAVDACRGTDAVFDPRIHAVRCQPGQAAVARSIKALLDGSEVEKSHEVDDPRVQDPYCLRATPQVLGAAFDTIDHVRGVFERELGAVTDNPLVFADSGDILSGGNFHGMPLAIAHDSLRIALTHIAGIAERRVYWILAASDSENPVNVYLSPNPGLHSGLMIPQYTAAACCNELQSLAHPASVGNIPTSAGMEDYNSMGATSAHQTWRAVELLRSVIAIEMLVMAEAMEYQRPLKSGAGVEQTHAIIRKVVPRLTKDRPPAPDIAAIEQLIAGDAFAAIEIGA